MALRAWATNPAPLFTLINGDPSQGGRLFAFVGGIGRRAAEKMDVGR
jgi:hypothetical protein